MQPTPPPLDDVWPIINRENWLDPSFSRPKAYVCAIFSELAYWHIPAFELGAHDNVKVVPSSAYQELQRRLVTDDFFTRILRERDLLVTVLDRRFAVVVIVQTPKAVFVAIRGTAYLYDWLVNAKLGKIVGPQGGRFHRGFYSAAYDFAAELRAAISAHKVPVYVTGHSLGGAMAAIVHGTFSAWRPWHWPFHPPEEWSHSAYTFGMPRYTNLRGILTYRSPYHLMKPEDIVPTVPPTWLGFANSVTEYAVSGKLIKRIKTREVWALPVWVGRLATKKAIAAHFIEGYRAALAT